MTATCTHPIETGNAFMGLCHSEIQFRDRSLASYRRCEYADRFLPALAVFLSAGLILVLHSVFGTLFSILISVANGVAAYYGASWLDIHWHAGRQHRQGKRGYRKLRRCERILRKSFEHARKNAGYGEYRFVDERVRLLITEAGATLTFLPSSCWPSGLTLFYSCSSLDNDFSGMRASMLAHFDDLSLLAARQVAATLFRTQRPDPPNAPLTTDC